MNDDMKVQADTLVSRLTLHIGYHKTASTWLQSVFIPDEGNNFQSIGARFEPRQDIVWPRMLDYESERVRAKYLPLLQSAVNSGKVPIISDERFSGNPMSGGFDSREIADRLKLTFPECKIVMVIREQKSMLYSTYDEYIREGGGSSIDRFLFPKSRYCMPPFRFEHFMYDRLIGYFVALFGPANVLVLPYELFRKDAGTFLSTLTRFSGATLDRLPADVRTVNESRSAAVLPFERRLNYFIRSDDLNGYSPLALNKADYYVKPILERLASHLPSSFGRRVKATIGREIEAACNGRFAKSNVQTELLTGLDLKQFGYDC
jgi:hypothetical protein